MWTRCGCLNSPEVLDNHVVFGESVVSVVSRGGGASSLSSESGRFGASFEKVRSRKFFGWLDGFVFIKSIELLYFMCINAIVIL